MNLFFINFTKILFRENLFGLQIDWTIYLDGGFTVVGAVGAAVVDVEPGGSTSIGVSWSNFRRSIHLFLWVSPLIIIPWWYPQHGLDNHIGNTYNGNECD